MKIKCNVLHQNLTTDICKCRISFLFNHLQIVRMQNKEKIHTSFGEKILERKFLITDTQKFVLIIFYTFWRSNNFCTNWQLHFAKELA